MKRDETAPLADPVSWGWTYEETRRRKLREGLALSPAERLEWLERTIEEWRPLVGAARRSQAPAVRHG